MTMMVVLWYTLHWKYTLKKRKRICRVFFCFVLFKRLTTQILEEVNHCRFEVLACYVVYTQRFLNFRTIVVAKNYFFFSISTIYISRFSQPGNPDSISHIMEIMDHVTLLLELTTLSFFVFSALWSLWWHVTLAPSRSLWLSSNPLWTGSEISCSSSCLLRWPRCDGGQFRRRRRPNRFVGFPWISPRGRPEIVTSRALPGLRWTGGR